MKRFACALFIVGAVALAGCAKTVIVPLAPDDSDAYKKAKSIFVVLKTAEIYEIENFSVQGDSLVGTRILRREVGTKEGERAIAIALDDISTIQVAKTSTLGAVFVGTGIGLVLATTIVAVALLAAFAAGLSGLN